VFRLQLYVLKGLFVDAVVRSWCGIKMRVMQRICFIVVMSNATHTVAFDESMKDDKTAMIQTGLHMEGSTERVQKRPKKDYQTNL